jgi:hypothetical protein
MYLYTKKNYDPHQYSIEYKNSHTTSTKCQYHAAHSNPTMWWHDALIFMNRASDTVRKMDPMMTCSP